MSTCSLSFLASFLVLAAILAVLRGRRWRQVVLILANAGFIASFHLFPATLVATAAFMLGTWGLLALAARKPSGKLLFAGVAGAVIFLVVVKGGGGTDLSSNSHSFVAWYNTVGLSYMVFKFIHVLVDVNQGQVRNLSFLTYLNYQLAFFTLTAGPINQYNNFEAAWNEDNEDDVSSPGLDESFSLWGRIFSGVIKMAIVAPFLGVVIAGGKEWVDPGLIPPAYLHPLLQFYLFPWQIYFDFSGYTDIAIGCAQLLGFKLPENFNRPFAARNIIDFWNRWHMSLTRWVRDYFFTPSYAYAAEHYQKHLRTAGYVLLGITMIIIGLWHGSSEGYLLFGIVSAIGMIAVKMWGDLLSARLGRAGYQRYLRNSGIRAFSVLATFHFFCFSELFFAVDTGKLLAFGKGILDEAARPWTAGAPAALLRTALIPVMASLVVLLYSLWTLEAAKAPDEHPPHAVEVGTATNAPLPATAVMWPRRIPRSYAPMALRAGLVAIFFLGQVVNQTFDPVGFYRWF